MSQTTTPEPIIGHDLEGVPVYADTELDERFGALVTDLYALSGSPGHDIENAIGRIEFEPELRSLCPRILASTSTRRRPGRCAARPSVSGERRGVWRAPRLTTDATKGPAPAAVPALPRDLTPAAV